MLNTEVDDTEKVENKVTLADQILIEFENFNKELKVLMKEFENKTGACIVNTDIAPIYQNGIFSHSILRGSDFQIKGTRR